jgi:glycine cleavage system H protein
MSQVLPNLLYTKEHEWIKVENDIAVVGITDFAQSSLGDVVFVELPELNRELASQEAFGVVESIKSVSDLYAPVSGKVVEKNEETEKSPELVNQGPFENWLIKVKIKNADELKSLMNADEYQSYCNGL